MENQQKNDVRDNGHHARPVISVIIPVYNREKYLEKCIASLQSQTIEDIEIVCVNDASTDRSLSVLESLASADDRIKIVNKTDNEGAMKARESGYKVAQGQFFFFLDSDDFLDNDTFEKLLSRQKETGAEIVTGNMQHVNSDGRTHLVSRSKFAVESAEDYLKSLFLGNSNSLCGSLFSRNLFDGCEYTALRHQHFYEDRILLQEILVKKRPRIATVNAVTYNYFVNLQSMSKSRYSDKQIEIIMKAYLHCWNYIATTSPELGLLNDRFLLHNIFFLISEGYNKRQILNYSNAIKPLLTFSAVKARKGLLFAIYSKLIRVVPFQKGIFMMRRVYRKHQGLE